MTKNIVKQIIIALLICIIIGLVLAVIFYQYIPSNAMIPAKVEAYETPENIASEIKDSAQEQTYETTNTLLEVTDSDLTKYKSTGSYNPGKSDPFAESTSDDNSVSDDTSESTQTSDNGNSKTSGTSETPETAKKESTTDNYYHNAGLDKGTK